MPDNMFEVLSDTCYLLNSPSFLKPPSSPPWKGAANRHALSFRSRKLKCCSTVVYVTWWTCNNWFGWFFPQNEQEIWDHRVAAPTSLGEAVTAAFSGLRCCICESWRISLTCSNASAFRQVSLMEQFTYLQAWHFQELIVGYFPLFPSGKDTVLKLNWEIGEGRRNEISICSMKLLAWLGLGRKKINFW